MENDAPLRLFSGCSSSSESANTETFDGQFFRNRTETFLQKNPPISQEFVITYTEWDLDEEALEFRLHNREKYRDFVHRLDKWFLKNTRKIITSFFRFYQKNMISFKHFKEFLVDMEVPATRFEMHLLCLLLDVVEAKAISLYNFDTRLKHLCVLEEYQDKKNHPDIAGENKFPGCQDEFVFLRFYSHDFKLSTNFKGHTKALLSTQSTVHVLIDVLNSAVNLHHRKYLFFREECHVYSADLAMPDTFTLKQFGFKGGPVDKAPRGKIIYTHNDPLCRCPLLRFVYCQTFNRELQKYSSFRKDLTKKNKTSSSEAFDIFRTKTKSFEDSRNTKSKSKAPDISFQLTKTQRAGGPNDPFAKGSKTKCDDDVLYEDKCTPRTMTIDPKEVSELQSIFTKDTKNYEKD